MPAAFVIAQMKIHDQQAFDRYLPAASQTVIDHGGEFIVGSTGPREFLDGEGPMPFLAIVKFPTYERAQAWYNSEGYAPLLDARRKAASGSVIVVQGIR